MVDIDGPLVAVFFQAPKVFLELKHGTSADENERSGNGCQSEHSAAKMEQARRQGFAS
jgi:hypothetical protein